MSAKSWNIDTRFQENAWFPDQLPEDICPLLVLIRKTQVSIKRTYQFQLNYNETNCSKLCNNKLINCFLIYFQQEMCLLKYILYLLGFLFNMGGKKHNKMMSVNFYKRNLLMCQIWTQTSKVLWPCELFYHTTSYGWSKYQNHSILKIP